MLFCPLPCSALRLGGDGGGYASILHLRLWRLSRFLWLGEGGRIMKLDMVLRFLSGADVVPVHEMGGLRERKLLGELTQASSSCDCRTRREP